MSSEEEPKNPPVLRPNRRTAIAAGGVAAAGAAWYATERRSLPRARVFVARGQRYDGPLATVIQDGLRACGVDSAAFKGKRVLLKPNLVEPAKDRPQMTTHPAVIVAAVEVFRGWGATVEVGEGPGHLRDSQFVLDESYVGEALRSERLEFADLNYQPTAWRANSGQASTLAGLHLPKSVVEADYVVSIPKLKTHHWVGMTCSLKNLYGVVPGLKYGWPKNVLHHHGIPETVYDINCMVPQTLAIVDGIDCMEGDGPILGGSKPMGLILAGANLTSIDATAARIIGMAPERMAYLNLAADRLGPVEERRIIQCGERWQEVASPFKVLPEKHLKALLLDQGAGVT
jgi:uncharacterized protein (DUF362 family)